MNYGNYFKYCEWQHEGFKVHGLSSAGIGTCLFLPELSLCIDVAQGLPFAMFAKNYLITHAHLDHSAGIPYIISQRAISNMKPPVFYMPEAMVEPMHEVMRAWQKLDGHVYNFEFRAAPHGETHELDKGHRFKAFETHHRVPSNGYTIFECRKKLKSEHKNKSREEILKFKQKGLVPTEVIQTPLFSYTGDTKIEFWDKNPEVLKSKILFMEVTYWDQKKSVKDARAWGHIHLDEVLERLEDFQGEKLVFMHISSRYTADYARKILSEKLPDRFQSKIEVFP